MIYSNTKGYRGISVTGPYYYPDHKASFYVGVLSSGSILDAEVDLARLIPWADGLENTLTEIADVLEIELVSKGLLIYGKEEMYGARAAVVRGEALKDADVKFEMYLLMLGIL